MSKQSFEVDLDYRFGSWGIAAPTDEQLQEALADVYDEERLKSFDEGKRDVILDTELRCESEDHTLCGINVSEGSWSGGQLLCWSEAGDGDALWTYQKDNVPYETTLELWRLLARGEVNLVEQRVIEIPSNPKHVSPFNIFNRFLAKLRRSNS